MTFRMCPHRRDACPSVLCFPRQYLAMCERGYWLGVQHLDLRTFEVPPRYAQAAASMTDEKLVTMWFFNGFAAALAGKGSLFWEVHAGVYQEMQRRGLKAEGMLS